MKITRLFVDPKGETHFEDVELPWAETNKGGKMSKRFPATGIIFRQTGGEYDYDWHNDHTYEHGIFRNGRFLYHA